MSSTWRTLPGSLRRDIALVCLADTLIAVSFGAVATGAGLPWWLPSLVSLAVFAGAAQFVFLGIAVAGGGIVAAVLAALLVNSRLLPLAYSVGDLFDRPVQRFVAAHMVTDESVAFAMNASPRDRRSAFWFCGVLLFVLWNIGTVIGALGGRAIEDVGVFGLDAAFPAVLVALVAPALRDRTTALAAVLGAVIALVATPFLPAGLPVLLALCATGVALLRRPGARTRSTSEQPDEPRTGVSR